MPSPSLAVETRIWRACSADVELAIGAIEVFFQAASALAVVIGQEREQEDFAGGCGTMVMPVGMASGWVEAVAWLRLRLEEGRGSAFNWWAVLLSGSTTPS